MQRFFTTVTLAVVAAIFFNTITAPQQQAVQATPLGDQEFGIISDALDEMARDVDGIPFKLDAMKAEIVEAVKSEIAKVKCNCDTKVSAAPSKAVAEAAKPKAEPAPPSASLEKLKAMNAKSLGDDCGCGPDCPCRQPKTDVASSNVKKTTTPLPVTTCWIDENGVKHCNGASAVIAPSEPVIVTAPVYTTNESSWVDEFGVQHYSTSVSTPTSNNVRYGGLRGAIRRLTGRQ